jgi:hypothetical protein
MLINLSRRMKVTLVDCRLGPTNDVDLIGIELDGTILLNPSLNGLLNVSVNGYSTHSGYALSFAKERIRNRDLVHSFV